MSRASFALAVVVAAVATTAGCSAGSGAPQAHRTSVSARPTVPGRAMVTWVGDVCAADEDLQTQQASTGTAALYITGRGGGSRTQIAGFVAAPTCPAWSRTIRRCAARSTARTSARAARR